ncbi:MAG TPA: tetratricopeptide repeat protein [Terriglobales bacterium]|nr:tetratricopeptide repeat protein [Terriglobales bacterium]
MRLRPAVVALLLAGTLSAAAQQGQPANPVPPVPCRDHTVDEYLAEIHQRHRNKNPLPENACILGWCRHPGAPGSDPVSHPPQAPPVASTQAQKGPPGESSSQAGNSGAAELRDTSLYDPIAGAKNAEAGDYYFDEKNYRAALSRYQEALGDKPDDPALHLRLGRTWEKLNDPAAAFEHYDAALILAPDGPGAKPAREGLERLRPQLEKAGIDTAKIHERKAAAIAASCPAAKP